jgi:hypothetical protein
MGGMYFFVFVPIVVVAEEQGFRQAIRLSIRVARLPGPRHMFLTLGYLSLSFLLLSSTPSAGVARATPPVGVWVYVLFVSFLHLSVLGAFAYRWLAVREPILAAAGDASRRVPEAEAQPSS